MNEILAAVVIGLASSLLASVAFLAFLTTLRPNIQISEQIAKSVTIEGEVEYRIKIVNKSHWPVNRIHAEFALIQYRNGPGGRFKKRTALSLRRSEVMQLLSTRADVEEEYADYAFRFSITVPFVRGSTGWWSAEVR